ncbi:TonB-dependent receptor [plant metagenome]|uniref:TonB-dependent receptor n=1 Tax=plant metagenome TaxID=1297885 RepID=A0A484PSS4_9ZZZZ
MLRRRFAVSYSTVLALYLALEHSLPASAKADSRPERSIVYAISAGSLDDVLNQFASQSGMQVAYSPQLVAGKTARGLSSRLAPEAALQQLLQGSGLTFEAVNGAMYLLKPVPVPERAPAVPAKAGASAAPVVTPTELDRITVTGTRIRGGTSASPTVTLDARRIEEEGFTDLGEVIRSVPQNFSGGQNPGVAFGAVGGSGSGLANQNITGGSALNLRGLGPDASLTLLNGRRLSYGGFVQAVDISAIPVEAVERVEIVADGASAIYGSDAVGGVANVILKREYEGVTVGTRYGTATDGGLATREYNVTTGTAWSSGGFIATYKDESSDPIYADERDYTSHLAVPTSLYPNNDLRSGLISAYQALGDTFELRLDALGSEREQSIYYDWGGTNRRQTKTTTTFVSPSIEVLLANDWSFTGGFSWGKDEHAFVQTRVTPATGAASMLYDECYCNESHVYEIGAEGPLFQLPGGKARLAVGAGYRTNEFWHDNYRTGATVTEGDESSRFAYAEVSLPLVAPDTGLAGVHAFSLTAAVRGEDYSSFGRVVTPKFGLVYAPSETFTLKTSWGKSFKAPTLYQRNSATAAYLDPPDYYGGTGYPADATALYFGGGNSDLEPERAKTWSTSLSFHPVSLPALEAELTWFDIDYTDRVVEPFPGTSQALSNPEYAQFISAYPTAEEQAAVLALADTFINFTDAPYDPANVVAILYGQNVNASRQRIKGIDLAGSYRFDLSAGSLTVRSSATWLDSKQQVNSAAGTVDLSGRLFNPAKINGRLGVVWNQGRLSASAFANYTDGVTDTVTDKKTGAFTTIDATLRYSTAKREGTWPGLDFALSVQNLFDRSPPLYEPASNTWLPYDSTNYSAIGRFLSASVSAHF